MKEGRMKLERRRLKLGGRNRKKRANARRPKLGEEG